MSEMPARIWAIDGGNLCKPHSGGNYVRADIAERMAEALASLIQINEEHNAAISRIVGHPIGWKDDYLNEARSALSAWKDGR